MTENGRWCFTFRHRNSSWRLIFFLSNYFKRVNDQKSGIGKFIFANGNQYEGEFLNSKKHGKGIFKFGKLDSACLALNFLFNVCLEKKPTVTNTKATFIATENTAKVSTFLITVMFTMGLFYCLII